MKKLKICIFPNIPITFLLISRQPIPLKGLFAQEANGKEATCLCINRIIFIYFNFRNGLFWFRTGTRADVVSKIVAGLHNWTLKILACQETPVCRNYNCHNISDFKILYLWNLSGHFIWYTHSQNWDFELWSNVFGWQVFCYIILNLTPACMYGVTLQRFIH